MAALQTGAVALAVRHHLLFGRVNRQRGRGDRCTVQLVVVHVHLHRVLAFGVLHNAVLDRITVVNQLMSAVWPTLHAGQQLRPALIDVGEPVLDLRFTAVVQTIRVRQVRTARTRAAATARRAVAGQGVRWLV